MTKVLIIEDEFPAVKKLTKQINQLRPDWSILAHRDSITSSVQFLKNNKPDIIFMDIHLADGDSFDIFNEVAISCPVIFTTAFSEYAIKAFKVNGLDYLLKPIPDSELQRVINKYIEEKNKINLLPPNIHTILQQLSNSYKERYLVKIGGQLTSVPVSSIAYFYSEDNVSLIRTHQGDRFPIDDSLDKIITLVNPKHFFRINRKCIIHVDAIQSMEAYFNGRLLIKVAPPHPEKSIVSRVKVKLFKQWLDR